MMVNSGQCDGQEWSVLVEVDSGECCGQQWSVLVAVNSGQCCVQQWSVLVVVVSALSFLQCCFDTIEWVTRRVSDLQNSAQLFSVFLHWELAATLARSPVCQRCFHCCYLCQ